MRQESQLWPPVLISRSGSFLLVVLLALAPARAQHTPGQQPTGESVRHMIAELNLDDAQQPDFRAIMRDFKTSMQALLDKHGIDRASGRRPSLRTMLSLRPEMTENRTRMETRLATILSPRQMRRFRALRKQQRAAWLARRQR